MSKHLLFHVYRGQFGWLWMLWFTCALQAVLGVIGVMNPALQILRILLLLGQCFLAGLAIVGGIQSHAMVGDRAFWKTRPIDRRELLRANAVFVFGCVWLPIVAGILIGSLAAGFSGGQLLLAAFEWSLFFGLGVTLVSAVAAHTRNLIAFFGAAGAMFGGFMLAGTGFRYLVTSVDALLPRSLAVHNHTSSILVGLVMVLVGAMFAVVWRLLRNDARVSIGVGASALLLFFPLVTYSHFGFLKPNLAAQADAEIELITEDFPEEKEPGDQVLWSHFTVRGVPKDSVFLPITLSCMFDDAQKHRSNFIYHQNSHPQSGADYLENSPATVAALRELKRRYPADTVWSGNWTRRSVDTLPQNGRMTAKDGAIGRFKGYLRGEFIAIKRVADLPLRDGFTGLGDGYGLSVKLIAGEEGGLSFEIREAVPELVFSRRTERIQGQRGSTGVYVLHHPDSREAIVLRERNTRNNAPTFLSNQSQHVMRFDVPRSILRERLNGHSADDWASKLRLHVYHPRRVSRLNKFFEDKNYTLRFSHRRKVSTWAVDAQVGFDSLKQLQWPGTNNPAAAQEFAHEFVTRAPANFYSAQSRETVEMLTKLGPEIVPFFLNEAPYSFSMGRVVLRRVFQQLATREHLPALKQALLRDPELALLVSDKRWDKDCAPVLIGLLSNREQVLPASALVVIARHATADRFTDLAWHASRCANEHDSLFRALRNLPGFPYEATVQDAWARARLQFVSDGQLAVFAAELGELDALHHLIRQMNSSTSEARDRSAFEILRPKLGVEGDDKTLRQWLLDHAAEIRFDRQRAKYVI